MPLRFMVMMRGYDRAEVDQLLARAEQAVGSSDAGLRAAVSSELQAARLRDCLRGYSRVQVDQKIEQLARELGAGQHTSAGQGVPAQFRIMMRGYDRAEVDQLLGRAQQATASSDAGVRAAACHDLQTARFRDRLRGYSRVQVNEKIAQLARDLSTAPPA
jgi:DivIVA domain-containing protein